MKLTLSVLALVAGVLAAPVAQGSYDDYGDYKNVPAVTVDNPPAPVGGYGDYKDVPVPPVDNPPAPVGGYGDYKDVPAAPVDDVPAPAGGYASYGDYKDASYAGYGTYKRGVEKAAADA